MIIVATLFGALIVTGIKIVTAAPAFVIKRSGFIMQILYNFRDYTKYPIQIYPSAIRFMLMFIFPFGLIISMPVNNIMFDSINPWLISLFIIIMAMVFLFLSVGFWNICVRRYESTGS